MKINKLVYAQNEKPNDDSKFYPRVVNKINNDFTDEEITLLHTGLKYNLNHESTHWLSNIALEPETAITRIPTHQQERVRYQVAHSLQKPYKQYSGKHTSYDKNTKYEYQIKKPDKEKTNLPKYTKT